MLVDDFSPTWLCPKIYSDESFHIEKDRHPDGLFARQRE